jgi:hypothetical protein
LKIEIGSIYLIVKLSKLIFIISNHSYFRLCKKPRAPTYAGRLR